MGWAYHRKGFASSASTFIGNLCILLGFLHLESLTDGAAELPLAMVDVTLQLCHRDTTMFARHAATIVTLVLSEESHGLRGWADG